MQFQQRRVPRSVFRAYDIRGIIGRDLDEHAYYSIGLALAVHVHALGRTRIFLARDGRLSSNLLALALKTGLLECGIDVFDLGEVATPVMYYATHTQGIDCGLMVTASHNPADYNGIKMVLAGKTLVQEDIDLLYDLVNAQKRYVATPGKETALDVLPAYRQRVVRGIYLKRPLKIVVDCGNGILGPVAPEVLRTLGCEVIPLYCTVDGRFPNHYPDPAVEDNVLDLKAAVLEHQADLGLAFDGDADRLGLVTGRGEIIWPDRLMILYARELLTRRPGAAIVFDVKCSRHLEREIKARGGIPVMCPTGHSIVKARMRHEHAVLAGEMSGHIFFKDRWYGFDDALYSACRLLEILSASDLSVHDQFQLIPNSMNTPELKIHVADDEKFSLMTRFQEMAQFPGADIITIDGMRVEFSFGWGLLRASNTTPNLVVRFEADDGEGLEYIKGLFKEQLHRVDARLELPF